MASRTYQRAFSFSGYQANTPQKPLPGPRVDIEFDEIAGVLREFGEALSGFRPLPPFSLSANLLSTAAFPQPVTFFDFKTTLGLKAGAFAEIGTTAGTVAAGNDARITGAAQASDVVAALQMQAASVATSLQSKADLIGGRVPIEQLPPAFSGAIPAANITDSTASGRAVLTGTPAVSRTALELGTAATRDAGVLANNAIVLDAQARLPAVDGSQLINLPGGTGGAAVALKRASGIACPQIMTQLERDEQGHYSIWNFLDKINRTNVQNGSNTVDLTAGMRTAFGCEEPIELGVGRFRISDKLTVADEFIPAPSFGSLTEPSRTQGKVIRGRSGRYRTVLDVGYDFNMQATSVIEMLFNAEISDFTMEFQQPKSGIIEPPPGSGAASGQQLRPYPWAVDMSLAEGCRVDGIKWRAAWNGIKCGRPFPGGGGGQYVLDRIEDGALNIGFECVGSLDFFQIINWESWVYDYGGTNLETYMYAHPGRCILRKNDGVHIGVFNTWQKILELSMAVPDPATGYAGLPGVTLCATIDAIKLDGPAAQVFFTAGNFLIGSVAHLSADVTTSPVVNVGAVVAIGSVNLESYTGNPLTNRTAPMILTSSGKTIISGGFLKTNHEGTHVRALGGILKMSNMVFTLPAAARQNALIVGEAAARLTVTDCTASDRVGGSGALIEIVGYNPGHTITDNFFGGWDLKLPASGALLGNYGWEDNTAVGNATFKDATFKSVATQGTGQFNGGITSFGLTASAGFKASSSPQTAWNFDASGSSISLPAGATIALAVGSGFLVLSDDANGQTSAFLVGGALITLLNPVNGAGYVASSSPSAGQIGLFFEGGQYKLRSARGAACNVFIGMMRTRPAG